jgi:hypothetical protein
MRSCCAAETGGVCTFCGAKVSLSKSGASELRPPAAERLSRSNAGTGAAQQPSNSAQSDSTAIAEAVAFKDRLVSCQAVLLLHPC